LKLFIDLDGVLADFDKSAEAILKTDNIYKYEFIWGPDKFWENINRYPDFFLDLPLKDDARHLWAKVDHLDPTILTALPRENGDRVDYQKRQWVLKNFKISGDRVITCPTKDKPKFCSPGDILIDDRAVNIDAWKDKGGIYIIHTNTIDTLTTMRSLGVI
jgi:5'(3')-deoxyribonucleotidase